MEMDDTDQQWNHIHRTDEKNSYLLGTSIMDWDKSKRSCSQVCRSNDENRHSVGAMIESSDI